MAAVLGPLRPEEERLFEGQPRGFPLEDFALEDVMLPEDDDMGIASEEDTDDEEEIETESGFGSVIGQSAAPLQCHTGLPGVVCAGHGSACSHY